MFIIIHISPIPAIIHTHIYRRKTGQLNTNPKIFVCFCLSLFESARLTTETIQGSTLSLQSINNI